MNIDLNKLKQGQRRALAKAITLIESKLDDHRIMAQEVLNELLPDTGKSLRIGISGVPGVGKSTFIEAFGRHLISQGKKVAVLAVDPSSPLRGGSILGDKTRMEKLAREERAFIRPSPSEGALGGVALRTRETMLLCEAAGYDVILVETVGVGQSEYEVSSMVDFFLVLMLPNAGDDLQGIKRGIMELADALVVNKSDGANESLAQQTKNHYTNAFHLLQHDGFWKPSILTCSSIENTGIEDVWNMIVQYETQGKRNTSDQGTNFFEEKRIRQNNEWLNSLVKDMIDQELRNNLSVQKELPELRTAVQDNKVTPYSAAHRVIELFLKGPTPNR